jgi:hypothetical protein
MLVHKDKRKHPTTRYEAPVVISEYCSKLLLKTCLRAKGAPRKAMAIRSGCVSTSTLLKKNWWATTPETAAALRSTIVSIFGSSYTFWMFWENIATVIEALVIPIMLECRGGDGVCSNIQLNQIMQVAVVLHLGRTTNAFSSCINCFPSNAFQALMYMQTKAEGELW